MSFDFRRVVGRRRAKVGFKRVLQASLKFTPGHSFVHCTVRLHTEEDKRLAEMDQDSFGFALVTF